MRRECSKIKFDKKDLNPGEFIGANGKIIRPTKVFDKAYYLNMKEEEFKKK